MVLQQSVAVGRGETRIPLENDTTRLSFDGLATAIRKSKMNKYYNKTCSIKTSDTISCWLYSFIESINI